MQLLLLLPWGLCEMVEDGKMGHLLVDLVLEDELVMMVLMMVMV